jgi:hypothetical protein
MIEPVQPGLDLVYIVHCNIIHCHDDQDQDDAFIKRDGTAGYSGPSQWEELVVCSVTQSERAESVSDANTMYHHGHGL